MPSALTIANFTLRKALREHVYVIFLMVTGAAIAAAGSVSFYHVGVQVKFLKDVSMLCLAAYGFLLALFLATELLPFELETRGIHFLASKPLSRWDLVLGKYLAFLALLASNLAPLALELELLVRLVSHSWDPRLLVGASLVLLESAVFGAMVLLLSSLVSRLLALFGGVLLYVVCHLSTWILDDFLASSPGWLRVSARAALAVLPDLSYFDSRFIVVHDYSLPPAFAALLAAYAVFYVAAALAAACWVLEAREL